MDNCVVLGKYCRGSTVAARAVRVFCSTSRSSSQGPGQVLVWSEPVVCMYSAAGVYVVAGAVGTHTHSGGTQSRQQVPRPTIGSQKPQLPWWSSCYPMAAPSVMGAHSPPCMHTTVEACVGGQASYMRCTAEGVSSKFMYSSGGLLG